MTPATLLDTRGHRCPYPVLALGKFAAAHPDANAVSIWASDPASRHDIPAWCQLTGHQLVASQEHQDYWSFDIRFKSKDCADHTG